MNTNKNNSIQCPNKNRHRRGKGNTGIKTDNPKDIYSDEWKTTPILQDAHPRYLGCQPNSNIIILSYILCILQQVFIAE